jgi:hypothetical protein
MDINIRHGIFGGIDTRRLEERMRSVDWQQHPGHWFFDRDDPTDVQLSEMRSIGKELDKLMRLEGEESAGDLWELLMVKYFSGTPLEYAISQNVPYLEASFTEYHELMEKSMDTAVNFYELKTQMADLGFNEPEVVQQLREFVLSAEKDLPEIETVLPVGEVQAYFTLFFGRGEQGQYELTCIDGSMDNLTHPGCQHMQYFQADVPAEDAIALLQLDQRQPDMTCDAFMPLNRAETQQQILLLKTLTIMNTQNLDFLKKSLLNLGFGEKVNEQLEKNINKKVPEFNLSVQHVFNQQKADYNLHFKAGENQEMYFFNKFDATLKKGTDKEVNQTFYINKGNGITAKEAFNLMEGRAVHKQLFNKDGEKYQAWLQLDDQNLTQNGSKEIKRFNENYGFDLEKVLLGKGIKELNTQEGQDNLFRSLKKGNAQQITVDRDGTEKKYFISASPQYKTVDLFDHQMKKIKREELLKPEQKQSNNQKQGKQQKEEELPGKKKSRGNKITV